MGRYVLVCGNGCGVCKAVAGEYEYHRTEDLDGNVLARKTLPILVSTCCGGEVEVWDEEREEEIAIVSSAPTMQSRIDELEREVRYLRHYGNKDCTHMADAAMERHELSEPTP